MEYVTVLITTGDGVSVQVVPGHMIWLLNLPTPCRARFLNARGWDMSHVPWTPPPPDAAGEINWTQAR